MELHNRKITARSAVFGLFFLLIFSCPIFPETLSDGFEIKPLTNSQIVYVPVYSHIFIGDRETPFLLAVNVLIRNTDQNHSIIICSSDYHDSNGNLLKRFLIEPVILRPLATTHFLVPESDEKGGAGANVIVTWKSSIPVNPPIIESVMIGTRSQQGISFTSRGQVLRSSTQALDSASSPVSLSGPNLR